MASIGAAVIYGEGVDDTGMPWRNTRWPRVTAEQLSELIGDPTVEGEG